MKLAILVSIVGLSLSGGMLRADGLYSPIMVNGRVGYVVPKEVVEKTDSEVRKYWLVANWPRSFVNQIDGFWTPEVKDIAASEEEIVKYLKAARTEPEIAFDFSTLPQKYKKLALLSAQHEIALILDNFKNYETQYVGIIVKGQRRMLCNYFDLEHLPPDFRKNLDPSSRIIDVNDGGHMYWHFEYDDVSRKCMHLLTNGPSDWELDWGIVPHANRVILQGDWTPAREETEKALMAVAAYMQNISFKNATTPAEKHQITEANIITKQMSRECVQFVGRTLHGRKLIYCNFFPCAEATGLFSDWQKSEVTVDGGGPAFWQICYDPETGKCSNLQINGPE